MFYQHFNEKTFYCQTWKYWCFYSSTDVTEWILLLIKTDLLKVCQSPFWKDRPLLALIEKLVNRPSIQIRTLPEYQWILSRTGLVGKREFNWKEKNCQPFSPSLNLLSLLRQRKYTLVFFEIQMTKKYYLEEDQLS